MGRKNLGRVLDRKRSREPSMKSFQSHKSKWLSSRDTVGEKDGESKKPNKSGVRKQRKVLWRRGEWASNAEIRTSCGRAVKRGYWIWQGGRHLVPSELCDLGDEDQSQAVVRRGRWGNENKKFSSGIGWLSTLHVHQRQYLSSMVSIHPHIVIGSGIQGKVRHNPCTQWIRILFRGRVICE